MSLSAGASRSRFWTDDRHRCPFAEKVPGGNDLLGPDEAEPTCAQCGATIGIFLKHGLTWQHYQGDSTTVGQQEIYSPGHDPVPCWRLLEDGLILC